ncbi:ArsR family transcriptional regulator [Candidatus Hodarchaeum mangrovi]
MRIIRDPKKVEVVVEKSRWELWSLLRNEGQMTAEKLADKLDKNVSTIYRHLKKLIDAGFVKEQDIQKGKQKYVIKEYSAELTDAFFILSEEAESLIASQPGEISYLQDSVPVILSYFKSLGFNLEKEEEAKTKEIMSKILIKLSRFIGDLIGEETSSNLIYDHEFEVMRRFLAMFLTQIDEEFDKQVANLRLLLLKK